MADIRRMADGTPRGHNVVLSLGSFSNATKYVCRKNVWNCAGTSLLITRLKKPAKALACLT